jgi:hypothetical protein
MSDWHWWSHLRSLRLEHLTQTIDCHQTYLIEQVELISVRDSAHYL